MGRKSFVWVVFLLLATSLNAFCQDDVKRKPSKPPQCLAGTLATFYDRLSSDQSDALTQSLLEAVRSADLWTMAYLEKIEGEFDRYQFSDKGLKWRKQVLLNFRDVTHSVPPSENEWALAYFDRWIVSSGEQDVLEHLSHGQLMRLVVAELRVMDPTRFGLLRNGTLSRQSGRNTDSMASMAASQRWGVGLFTGYVVLEILRTIWAAWP